MDEKLKQIQKLLDAAEGNLHSARNLFREIVGTSEGKPLNVSEKTKDLNIHEEGKIIEGVYTGETMIGPDGKEYPVPANYASKSKLVEGDVLKLTIAEDGSFIFKQINPVERTKTIGTLSYDGGNYTVNADGKSYKVLQASVTYYKGEPGDSVTIIIPKEHEAKWAAIENIVKKVDSDGNATEMPVPEATADNAPAEEAKEEKTDSAEVKPEETEVTEPTIEFPSGNAEPSVEAALSQEDQNIAANLGQTTTTETSEPVVEPTVNPPETETTQQNDKPDEGIKELEI